MVFGGGALRHRTNRRRRAQQIDLRAGDLPARRAGAAAAAVFRKPPAPRQRRYRRRILRASRTTEAHRYRFSRLGRWQQALFHQQFPRRSAAVSQQLRQRHLSGELAQSLVHPPDGPQSPPALQLATSRPFARRPSPTRQTTRLLHLGQPRRLHLALAPAADPTPVQGPAAAPS